MFVAQIGTAALHAALNSTGNWLAVSTLEGNIALRGFSPLEKALFDASEVHFNSKDSSQGYLALKDDIPIVNTVGVRSRSKVVLLRYANLQSNPNLLLAVYKNGEVYIITTPHDPIKCRVQQLFKFTTSPILDACFSADDQIIAFTTMNNDILIWDLIYSKFINNLHLHQLPNPDESSPVKGIAFDHVANNRMITLGDDKILNIIQYQLVHDDLKGRVFKYEITQINNNIIQSAKLNKFSIKKLSWSIDDYLFSVPNTSKMKNSKIALLGKTGENNWTQVKELNSQGFKTFMSLISPNVFQNENGENVYVMATLSPDSIVAIWRSDQSSPIHVSNEISSQPIQDFCWSLDSRILILTSSSGNQYVAVFKEGEFGKIKLSLKDTTKDLNQLTQKLIPREFERMSIWRQNNKDKIIPPIVPVSTPTPSLPPQNLINGSSKSPSVTPAIETLTTSSTPKVNEESENLLSTATTTTTTKAVSNTTTNNNTNNTSSSSTLQAPKKIVDAATTKKRPLVHTDFDLPSNSIPKNVNQKMNKSLKDETLKKRRDLEQSEFVGSVVINPQISFSKIRIAIPKIQIQIKYSPIDNNNYQLKIQNGSGFESQPSRISLNKNDQQLFVDFIPQKIHIVTGNEKFWAISTINGQVIVYTSSGHRVLPIIILGSPLSFLEIKDKYLLAVTSVGELFVWDLIELKSVFKPNNLISLLSPRYPTNVKDINLGETNGLVFINGEILTRSETLTMCSITKDGIPIVTLNNGDGYLFNKDMNVWTLISESWWAFGSQYWDSTRSNNQLNEGPRGLLEMLEGFTNDEINKRGKMKMFNKISKIVLMRDGFENLEIIVSLNHLENKINYYKMMNDKLNYKSLMITYVNKLSEFKLKNRLHEIFSYLRKVDLPLLKDLLLTCAKFKDVQDILVQYAKVTGVVQDNDIL